MLQLQTARPQGERLPQQDRFGKWAECRPRGRGAGTGGVVQQPRKMHFDREDEGSHCAIRNAGGKKYECLLDIGIGLQRAGRLMVNHHNQKAEFEEEKTVPCISQRISGLSRCYRVLAGRAAVMVRPLWVDTEGKELSSDDPDVVQICTRLASGEEKPRWNEMSEFSLATKAYSGEWQRLVMKDGVIYRKWASSDGAKVHTQVLVPTGKWKEILQQAHGERWTSHLGVERTVVCLHERYFWHDMGADVRSWLAQCGVCVKAKGPGGRTRKNPMTIVRSGTPFETA